MPHICSKFITFTYTEHRSSRVLCSDRNHGCSSATQHLPIRHHCTRSDQNLGRLVRGHDDGVEHAIGDGRGTSVAKSLEQGTSLEVGSGVDDDDLELGCLGIAAEAAEGHLDRRGAAVRKDNVAFLDQLGGSGGGVDDGFLEFVAVLVEDVLEEFHRDLGGTDSEEEVSELVGAKFEHQAVGNLCHTAREGATGFEEVHVVAEVGAERRVKAHVIGDGVCLNEAAGGHADGFEGAEETSVAADDASGGEESTKGSDTGMDAVLFGERVVVATVAGGGLVDRSLVAETEWSWDAELLEVNERLKGGISWNRLGSI